MHGSRTARGRLLARHNVGTGPGASPAHHPQGPLWGLPWYPQGMADQIVLSWIVDVSGTPLGPTAAAVALGAVPLYDNVRTDPVLGQLFGLTVASDVSAATSSTEATRTLTLNMNLANAPGAPPPFPCQPVTSTPPELPYPLTRSSPLGGSFFVTNGVAAVPATRNQTQTLSPTDIIEFLSQQGVQYTILTVTETTITLTAVFTGRTTNTGAFQRVPAPATRLAVYSTSDLDTNAVAETVPPIVPGPGGHDVEIEYFDSTGAGPFDMEIELTGKRPAAGTLEVGSIDVAVITAMQVEDPGAFTNSIGQITLVELSDALPELPFEPTQDEFRGSLTDEAQLLIDRHLVYLPPSYHALAQQQASTPQLDGDFFVTTNSTRVVTEVDQTAALAADDIIQFASQLTIDAPLENQQVFYVVEDVAPRSITLTEPYTGIDENFTGNNNINSDAGTKGNIGAAVSEKRTAAFLIEPSPASEPTEDQLSQPLAQFVEPETAAPPLDPPLAPATIPTPTFLSDLFTQTLQLALAGVSIDPQEITFLP